MRNRSYCYSNPWIRRETSEKEIVIAIPVMGGETKKALKPAIMLVQGLLHPRLKNLFNPRGIRSGNSRIVRSDVARSGFRDVTFLSVRGRFLTLHGSLERLYFGLAGLGLYFSLCLGGVTGRTSLGPS